jgi:kynurenine formamidase
MGTSSRLPRYQDLPRAPDLSARTAWDVFGPDDHVGTLQLLTPERVRHAASLVRKGAVFSLNWRLEVPDPPMFGRRPLKHRIRVFPNGMDDSYDDFYPQASTQWDALSHIGHPRLGYFGGRSATIVNDPETNPLGIEWWSRRGIAGRFVLVDIGRARDSRGEPLDWTEPTPIEVPEIETTLRAQNVVLKGGDIVLFRFGWMGCYEKASLEARTRVAELGHTPTPGLSQDEAVAEWLWDHEVAAVAADNPGVERYPANPDDLDRYLHYRLITFLGMAIGEMFALDDLAADCAADGAYEGLLTSAPLNKRGGSGSPANVLALK